MDELKRIVAKNIAELRRDSGLTQLQLAEKLNYSDKAVSKWESGASIPDVAVLLSIANLFGVTVEQGEILAEKGILSALYIADQTDCHGDPNPLYGLTPTEIAAYLAEHPELLEENA